MEGRGAPNVPSQPTAEATSRSGSLTTSAVPHFQLVTTDGSVPGARELGRPDWPPGASSARGRTSRTCGWSMCSTSRNDDPEMTSRHSSSRPRNRSAGRCRGECGLWHDSSPRVRDAPAAMRWVRVVAMFPSPPAPHRIGRMPKSEAPPLDAFLAPIDPNDTTRSGLGLDWVADPPRAVRRRDHDRAAPPLGILPVDAVALAQQVVAVSASPSQRTASGSFVLTVADRTRRYKVPVARTAQPFS
jgi:hypothetical protein